MMVECEVCGELFQTLRRWKGVRTCSPRCRTAAWRSSAANRQAERERLQARRELARQLARAPRPLIDVLD
jgi:hypothetical protein